MKNTFAVTSALLLALTLGGSFAAYRMATAEHHAAAEAHSGPATEAGGEASANAHGGTGEATDQATTGSNMGTEGTQPSSTPVAGNGAGDNAGPSDTAAPTHGGSAADTGETVATTTAAAAAGATGATGESPNQTAQANELEGDRGAGSKTFAASCAGCHGANAEGGVGPALNVVKDWSLEQFTAAVREGKAPDRELAPMMPRFSDAQLTDADMANVFTHLKTF
ncbi:c-type cytochrome [Deinococcus taklimakanensis]|uniref:C-type cytochrome n=1 Tax=Deinococcus taklimakanensis TaxID=536443 RepID=A0ABW5P5E6_9DEIO